MEQVTRSQAKLIAAIEDKKWGRCRGLTSPAYGDRWGFDRRKLGLALKDVGSQFVIVLDLEWTTESTEKIADDHYSISGRGRLTGMGTAFASAIESQAARYGDALFTFHWKKQSWLPWDWQLQKIAHPSLSIPSGYTPGDLSAAEDFGF